MKTRFLLPNSWRLWGWLVLIPSVVVGILMNFYAIEPSWLNIPTEPFDFRLLSDDFINFQHENIFNELILAFTLISLFVISFSREKLEDELIANLRLESLLWMVYFYCILLLVANFLLFGGWFFSFMSYNLYTPLIIYFLRFRYLIYRLKKDSQ